MFDWLNIEKKIVYSPLPNKNFIIKQKKIEILS